MRLVGVALLDQRLRRELPAPARSRRWAEIDGKRPNVSASSLSSGSESRLPTRNAPPRPPAHWRVRKATIASRENVRRCSSGPSTGRPSGWSPNAARSIRCSATTDGWSLERAISWITTPRSRSSSSASIFGRPDEVGQQVDRLGRRLGAAGDVEGDEVVRGVGVEHRAHPLGRLVDLAVVVVLLAALEHEVLEEVGHAVLLGTLGAGAGVEGDEDGQGAGARGSPRGGCGRPLGRVELWIEAIDVEDVAAAGNSPRHQREPLARYPHPPVWPPPNVISAAARARAAAARPADPARHAGVDHRLPQRLQALPERRHGPRRRVVRHRAGRVRVPGRRQRLRQVDHDAAADQGDRGHRRRDHRRRARPVRHLAPPRARTTGATSASSTRTTSCSRTGRSTRTSPTRSR